MAKTYQKSARLQLVELLGQLTVKDLNGNQELFNEVSSLHNKLKPAPRKRRAAATATGKKKAGGKKEVGDKKKGPGFSISGPNKPVAPAANSGQAVAGQEVDL